MSIVVEILVRAPMDALWAHTQTPALHESWDLKRRRGEKAFGRVTRMPVKARVNPPGTGNVATLPFVPAVVPPTIVPSFRSAT